MRKKIPNSKFNSGDNTFVTSETAAASRMFAQGLRQFVNRTAVPPPALLAYLLAQVRANPAARPNSGSGRPPVLGLFSDATTGLIADNAGQLSEEARHRVDTVFLSMLDDPRGFETTAMARQFQSITGLIRLGLVGITLNALSALPDDVIHAAIMRHRSDRSPLFCPGQLSSTKTTFNDGFAITCFRSGAEENGPPEFVMCTSFRANRTLIALWDEVKVTGQTPTNDPSLN